MPFVRFAGSYRDFVAGRSVSEAVHHEDDADGVVGFVSELRAGDEEISASDHVTEAAVIRDYNAALPVSESPPASPTLTERLTGATSVADIRQALIDHFEPPAPPPRTVPDPRGGPAA